MPRIVSNGLKDFGLEGEVSALVQPVVVLSKFVSNASSYGKDLEAKAALLNVQSGGKANYVCVFVEPLLLAGLQTQFTANIYFQDFNQAPNQILVGQSTS